VLVVDWAVVLVETLVGMLVVGLVVGLAAVLVAAKVVGLAVVSVAGSAHKFHLLLVVSMLVVVLV